MAEGGASALDGPKRKGTTASSSRQRMERIGRTQRTPLSSQRMDLGQETAASASGSRSASSSPVGRPFSCVTANQTGPLGVSRCSQSSSVRPVDLRNPWIAFSGASTRGPLRSTVMSGCSSRQARTSRARRRGVAKVSGFPNEPASLEQLGADLVLQAPSPRPPASAPGFPRRAPPAAGQAWFALTWPSPPARPRSRPWPARGRARCRPRAPPR